MKYSRTDIEPLAKTRQIQAKLSQEGLIICTGSTNGYQLLIKSLEDVEGLSTWFDSLELLKGYIQDESNVKVKENGLIEIIHRPPTKKQGCVVIAKLQLSCPAQKPLNQTKQAIYSKAQIKKAHQQTHQEQIPEAKSVADLWVDPKINDYWRLIFNNTLVYNKYGTAVVLGTQIINTNPQFTINVTNFLYSISIGIIDQKLKYLMPGKKNMISYINNSTFWGGEKQEENKGLGYKVHENVTVKVKMNEGIVEWKVGEQVRYSYKTGLFEDKNIVWVPFVFLSDSGDNFRVFQ